MAEEKKLILPFDDFEPEVEELEKACEEHQEEVKKTFEDELKIANEINGDEHTKAFPEEPKLPKNEKLILKEPETSINEKLSPDLVQSFRHDLLSAVNDVTWKYHRQGLDESDIDSGIAWVEQHFWDGGDDMGESCNKLNEAPNAANFGSDVYDALAKVMYKYRDDDVSITDLKNAVKWFVSRFSYNSEWDESLKTLPRRK